MSTDHQDSKNSFSLEVSRERVESLWRQVASHRGSARDDLAAARASRSKAEMERQRIAAEALDTTRQACGELMSETERQLMRAKEVEAQVEKKLSEAQEYLSKSELTRAEAESYREKIVAEAHQELQRIRDEARSVAMDECAELKRHVAYEVEALLADIDAMKAAAQEELEAQRIYTDTARLDTMSRDVRERLMTRVNNQLGQGNSVHGNGNPSEETEQWDGKAGGEDEGADQDSMPTEKLEEPVSPKGSKKAK